MNINSNGRQYDLDWIRVLATFGVFLNHSMMFFNPFPWHVKNNEIDSSWILVFSLFIGLWIMPIFFVISGMNSTYSLSKRSTITFIKERLKRIGIPLLFGIFILSPPQVYIERITNLRFTGTFFEFIPYYFDGLYLDIGGDGNFAFSGLHLWYLLVLLVFSFIFIILFKVIPIRATLTKFNLFLFPILLFLSGMIHTLALGGWDLIIYFIVFLYGCYFFSNSDFKGIITSTYKITMPITVIATITYIVSFMIGLPSQGSIQDFVFYGMKVLACWGWICVIFHLGNRYLSFSNHFLTYTSEATMPFYVLHQPIIVLIGYMIYDFSWSIPIKLLFLITVSFVLIMTIYHFVIRKVKILRILFGLKI